MRRKLAKLSGYAAEASFTLEAAALMLIILPVLVAMLLIAFYLHDEAELEAAASELTAAGSCLTLYDDREERLQAAVKRSAGSLIWTVGTSGEVSVGEKEISASFSGTFSIPGMIAHLMRGGQIRVEARSSYQVLRQAETIRKIRGVRKVAAQLTESPGS